MKKIIIISILQIFICGLNLFGQNQRLLKFNSYCNQVVYNIDTTYHLWYYKSNDSTLIIKGLLGTGNCADVHVFSAIIDSNSIVLSEQIIDTMPVTCMCDIRITMEIDSFYFNTAHINFNGHLITSTSDLNINKNSSIKIIPNPANDYFSIDLPNTDEVTAVKIIDILGNVHYNSFVTNKFDKIDITGFKKGLYFVLIGDKNYSLKLLIQ
ncbi:MAG: T9SS type A sorting domain-containing protein [Bacteroidetes bacterium]|nr:T9SS type A sorting domain-containing protein [Bacteroidota bacterium]